MEKRSIFINYRREDSAGHTGRLNDRLKARFPRQTFMDVDDISYGDDFVEAIKEKLGSCGV
jgi:hypothetical protein